MDRVGERKVDSAKKTLTALNPDVNVVTYDVRLGADNVLQIIDGYDLIVDGTDNFPTRYLANDAAHFLGKPLVHGAIYRFEGQLTLFDSAHGGPCYRCLFESPPPLGSVPSCAEAGVFGVLPGIIGSLMAFETIKHILNIGETLSGRLMIFEGLDMRFRQVKLRKNEKCVLCGTNPTVTELIDYEQFCGMPSYEPSEATA
jgi:adenylyltransferase/sulfurtransferase